MRKVVLSAFLACVPVVCAQSPTDVFEKAPPEIDKALRERVSKFFQAQVDGKFRLAEEVIHEDSRDAYYNAEKQRFLGYEIARINYSDNFTKATVVATVELFWSTPRLGKIRVKPPVKSLWKVDRGEWWWYVVPEKEWSTPFGSMKPGENRSGNSGQWSRPDPAAVLSQVKADRLDIRLKSYEKSEDSAVISNGLPGDVSLRVENPSPTPNLNVSLDKETLKKGETARVIFRYDPDDPSPKISQTVNVIASPTGQLFTFRITFAVPPEMQKQLPTEQP